MTTAATLTPALWDDASGLPVEKPSDLDFRATDCCDYCGKRGPGTMHHAAGATGRVCPVFFLGDCCRKR